ncbi:upstream stimulatory factor 1-like isoform X1 [Petromyzon marinus]|uniref:Upstream stimulatory factor 1-like isoform X3 n=1 Tax=Petromyzon marinus TaxID=7757 RepID=A0AAJ7UGN3_PETMA|nr:upstream stimulatory factor 1-like isoform X3 [Petromyzon marinus]
MRRPHSFLKPRPLSAEAAVGPVTRSFFILNNSRGPRSCAHSPIFAQRLLSPKKLRGSIFFYVSRTSDADVSDDQASEAIAGAAFGANGNIQYQFRTESCSGQVTYRVVQVTDELVSGDGAGGAGGVSVVTTAGFPSSNQTVTQAVIQGAFSTGESAEEESGGETRFAYFPASAVGGDGTAIVAAQSGETTLSQAVASAGGQFYVMMAPQEVLQATGQRTIAPRTHAFSASKGEGPRTVRDDKRRAQHNEVERRRRDKINNWIVQLSKILPDSVTENSKTGQEQSKGGILSKACDYIQELRQTQQQLADNIKETERLHMDNELLRQQVEELRSKNTMLRAHLQQNGITVMVSSPGQ